MLGDRGPKRALRLTDRESERDIELTDPDELTRMSEFVDALRKRFDPLTLLECGAPSMATRSDAGAEVSACSPEGLRRSSRSSSGASRSSGLSARPSFSSSLNPSSSAARDALNEMASKSAKETSAPRLTAWARNAHPIPPQIPFSPH